MGLRQLDKKQDTVVPGASTALFSPLDETRGMATSYADVTCQLETSQEEDVHTCCILFSACCSGMYRQLCTFWSADSYINIITKKAIHARLYVTAPLSTDPGRCCSRARRKSILLLQFASA